jgi:uncharacterized membrane protein
MNDKKFGILALFLVGILAFCTFVNAAPNTSTENLVNVQSVEVDGTEIDFSGVNVLSLEKNNEFSVKVVLQANADQKDVQVEAYMRGYDHSDLIGDITDTFNMKAGTSYSKRLTLVLPENMDNEGSNIYFLRIRVEGRAGASTFQEYQISVDSARHDLVIKDIVLTPDSEVQAGRALLASVRVRNYGAKDEDGIKVAVAIPDLNIVASDYIDTLDADKSTSSEELYLRIPTDAVTGVYKVVAEVIYQDGDKKVIGTTSIKITGEAAATQPATTGPETVINIGPESQDVISGQTGAIYPLTITNNGKSSKTYTVSADGVDWGTTKLSPTNVVIVGSGETKAVYISVAANSDTQAGKRMFSVTVSQDGTVLKQIPLTANVVAGQQPVASDWLGIRRGLEIGIVVVVVLLVIIGLVIGFNKLKGNEEEEDSESEKTYY